MRKPIGVSALIVAGLLQLPLSSSAQIRQLDPRIAHARTVALAFDTGFVAWDWQFWLMFAPMFAASELALHEVCGDRPST